MIMNEEQQAKILVNNEIKVTDHRSEFVGQTGLALRVMADGRTLEVALDKQPAHKTVFLDVTLVSEIQEPMSWQRPVCDNLGPIANHLVKDTI